MKTNHNGLRVVDQWAEAGSPVLPNEDGWAFLQTPQKDILCFLDGCTDLDADNSVHFYPDGQTSSHWYKTSFLRHLRDCAADNLSDNPKDLIAEVIGRVRKDYEALGGGYDGEPWRLPSATIIILFYVAELDVLRISWLSDSYCLIRKNDGSVLTLPPGLLDKERSRPLRTETISEEEKWRRERVGRTKHITECTVSVGLFPDRLQHLHAIDIKASECSEILAASDGFFRLWTDYDKAPTPEQIMEQIKRLGLAEMGRELRRQEAGQEAYALMRHAKSKDDATAVLLQLTL